MLRVQIDSILNSLVSNNISLCKVLSDDAGSWLLLLCDLVGVALGVTGDVVVIIVGSIAGAGDLDLGGAELGVVEEESCLCGGGLLESHGCVLGLA